LAISCNVPTAPPPFEGSSHVPAERKRKPRVMNAPVLGDAAPGAATPDSRPANASIPSEWRPVAIPLGLGLLLLGVTFKVEVAAAIQTWIQSTAYNHCFLVIPIAAFLLWERRSDIAGLTAKPTPWVGLLGVPIAVVWLIAERLGIMEGRQLAAFSFVELLFLAVLGRRFWWAASGPLLYLYFLVPFGEFLTPKLQDITTLFIRHGLAILGIPAYIDGYIIEIPQGTFLVAEACAGLRFLIASIAFGCLYALMMYRSPVRRGVFIAISIVVPIIANGLRGLGIVYLGYLLGSAQAAAADHIIYGWIFFSAVILLLIALGLPFRQDDMPPPPPNRAPPSPSTPMRPAIVATLVLLIVAAISPVLSAGLAMTMVRTAEAPAAIDVGPGCTIVATDGPKPSGVRTQRVACGTITMEMTWEAFSPRVTAAPVMQERRLLCQRAETEQLTESWLPDAGNQSRAWQIMRSGDPVYVMGVSIWIDGKPVRPGMAMRLRMALNSLFGSGYAPIIMTVSPAVSWGDLTPAGARLADANLVAFLQAHPDLDARVGAASSRR